MRLGFNPHKDEQQIKSDYFHQVVIPVYIPNQEGYFKDSFEILKICLNSLLITAHSKTYITIVNNGSDEVVINYLDELYRSRKIQELVHVSNIGYVNAMLKGIAGQNFEFITTADADVLFLNGWQEASYNIFKNFSKTGAVCPTPSSRSLRTYTGNIYWDLLFTNKLKFSEVENPNAMHKFGLSVGNKDFYNEIHLKKYLTVSNNNQKAVIGAGHFVVTYRADIFNTLKKRFTDFVMGGGSDDLFDIPVVKSGFWRLSTANNYAYHMGNCIEDWMIEEVSKLEKPDQILDFKLETTQCNAKWLYFFKTKLFGKFILNKKIMTFFLIWKGLRKEDAKNYLK